MQLRNQVEWALHCCGILAGVPDDRYLPTKALAEFHGVPKEYLSKALQALSQAGLVESTLGPSGGYRLARPPEAISFLDIVEAVEGKASTFVCTNIRFNNPCVPTDDCAAASRPCAIARVMWEADKAWRDRLKATTLADLGKTLVTDLDEATRDRIADWVQTHS
ncbi:RrF2 family transcriptional regulator [Gimibacter soli]|uniref:Rrf2 family transcriptional regulator n=1 Tax=Gimibacter soli TaxID=3024400 RepID=A0AAE9XPC2_9PROT|nr:Rrf2 family transcriptional regulator [Gimibacter soli]WCL54728.1 Rrf2 family transcriptional regulator [Gimibacter soli]